MQEFGRGLVLEPYLASIVLAGGVVRRAGGPARDELLNGLMDGSRIGALAYAEADAGFDPTVATLKATPGDGGWRLDGEKCAVLNGDAADVLIVSAVTNEGLALFSVAADAPGVRRTGYPTVDGGRGADIVFDGATVGDAALLIDAADGAAVLEDVIDEAILAVSAEACGIMAVLNDKTLEYTKSRVQFGVPIASFQALQHRMVDMFMDYEQTKSLLLYATMAQAARRCRRTPLRRVGAESAGGQRRTTNRPGGRAASRRHGRYLGARRRTLFQAPDDDRYAVRQRRLSSAPLRIVRYRPLGSLFRTDRTPLLRYHPGCEKFGTVECDHFCLPSRWRPSSAVARPAPPLSRQLT